MASTYSALKIELIGTGEQSGTWGTTTNNNLGNDALGEAITGSADVAFTSSDVTVTLTNTNASQAARNLRLNLTGTSGGARQLILGSGCQIEKLYLINNGLADAVTVKNTSGTGIVIPAGKSTFVFNNGTNVVEAANYFPGTASSGANSDITSLSGLTTPLSIAQGGTGTSSTTFTNLTTNVTGTLPIANGGTGSASTTFVNAATNVIGTLPIANGGTGSSSTTYASLTANVSGTLPVANGGTGVTGSTGSGNNVLSTSPTLVTPTLVTPILGTPASGDLTNCTNVANTAKAWVNFNGLSGASPVIRGSFNVSSVTRTATGQYTIAFTSTLADVNYAVTGNASTEAGGRAIKVCVFTTNTTVTAPTTSSFVINLTTDSNVSFDAEYVTLAVFR